jgi:hypothetical protein
VQSDANVSVAFANNLAEAELIQGLLQTAGIPSFLREVGTRLPYLGPAGPREIYVPAAAAEQAQLVLATQDAPAAGQPDPPTTEVGLERTGMRLGGKAAAALMLLGPATAAIYSFASGHTGIAIVSLAVLVVVIAAIVTWSERRSELGD